MRKSIIGLSLLGFVGLAYSYQSEIVGSWSKSVNIDVSSDSTFKGYVDGQEVRLYSLQNKKVMITMTNYGARLVTVHVPDKMGRLTDVILGYDSANNYKANFRNFYGAVIGRYANRIGDARFTLNGTVHRLEKNNDENSLHGGMNGIHNKVWEVESYSSAAITMVYTSPDKEAGYPGVVKLKVTYTLNKNNSLAIEYSATQRIKKLF